MQGRCMPKAGGVYHSARHQYEGNFFNDGITYKDCAKKCIKNEYCAGFDVWKENNDCELFFDEHHFGDGSSEEECFIRNDFV